jgi:hypothetical protein
MSRLGQKALIHDFLHKGIHKLGVEAMKRCKKGGLSGEDWHWLMTDKFLHVTAQLIARSVPEGDDSEFIEKFHTLVRKSREALAEIGEINRKN